MSASKSSAGGAPTGADTKVEEKSTAGASKVEEKSVLELLEEDDEFEEFEGGNLDLDAKDAEEGQLWQDDWDDDDQNDDFTDTLRKTIEAGQAAGGGVAPTATA